MLVFLTTNRRKYFFKVTKGRTSVQEESDLERAYVSLCRIPKILLLSLSCPTFFGCFSFHLQYVSSLMCCVCSIAHKGVMVISCLFEYALCISPLGSSFFVYLDNQISTTWCHIESDFYHKTALEKHDYCSFS